MSTSKIWKHLKLNHLEIYNSIKNNAKKIDEAKIQLEKEKVSKYFGKDNN